MYKMFEHCLHVCLSLTFPMGEAKVVARPVYCVSTEAGCQGQTDFKILLCQLAAAFVVTSYISIQHTHSQQT